MNSRWRVIALLLFGSGLSALVYQTAWQRAFRLTFGASTSASAAVLAVFMGGLGIGGIVLGRRIEKSPRPLAVYGNLELAIALLAAVSPLLDAAVHRLYLALGGSTSLGPIGATLARLLGTTLVIGPATFLMGGTLPAAARALVAEDDTHRSRLGLLYALNTIGAVVGSLVGPLVLFGVLGTRLTLWAAVLVNLLVALAARALARGIEPIAEPASRDVSGDVTPPLDAESALPVAARSEPAPADPRLVHTAALATGFVFLALELVWYRMLGPLLGGSSITFGLILATALTGIGVGSFLYAKRTRPVSLGVLAATLAVEGVFVLLPFAWGDDLAFLVAHLREWGNLGFGYLVASWILVASIVVFPAAVVSGYQFPLLFALLGRGRDGVARQIGLVYGSNTVGTIAGSLLGGFVLVPALGAVTSWRWLGLSLLALGAVYAVISWTAKSSVGQRRSIVVPVLAVALGVTLAVTQGPGGIWRHTPIGAGRLPIARRSPNELTAKRRLMKRDVIWERDGIESSVAISVRTGIQFIVNGKSDGSVIGDRGTQVFIGLLPALLHGHVKSSYVVGLGSGMTAGILGRVPEMEKVTVAELEPSIVEVARWSRLANGDVLDNPRVDLQFGDGRELLLTSREDYDLIVSEPSNPYRIGISALFTREFYEAANSRLRPGGYFAQWIQGYEIDAATLASALHTLRQVFPHVSVWGPDSADLLLVASHHEQKFDVARLEELSARPEYRSWMERTWAMDGAESVLAHLLVPAPLVDQLIETVPHPVNTDDLNHMEFAFARLVGMTDFDALSDMLSLIRTWSTRPAVNGNVDWDRVDDLRARIRWPGYRGLPPSEREQATQRGCKTSVPPEQIAWPEGAEPRDVIELWSFAKALAGRGDDRALAAAVALEKSGYLVEARFLAALHAETRGDATRAVQLSIEALEGFRTHIYPLCQAGLLVLSQTVRLGRIDPAFVPRLLGAFERPFALYELEDERWRTRLELARLGSTPAVCLSGLGDQLEDPLWSRDILAVRASCLRDANHPAASAALDDLFEFLESEPTAFSGRVAEILAPGGWTTRTEQSLRDSRVPL